ncbi:hypothetical protein TWF679_011262 [Orbilia oligospora]|uniref:Uncharacterized protein n=1 Tax=Orbilia oligospora TaxID=2813651 RepID=A0A8H8UYF5_ORBOL|nr:hypothetical protein TWF679_011262 [Orbilia oligospora]
MGEKGVFSGTSENERPFIGFDAGRPNPSTFLAGDTSLRAGAIGVCSGVSKNAKGFVCGTITLGTGFLVTIGVFGVGDWTMGLSNFGVDGPAELGIAGTIGVNVLHSSGGVVGQYIDSDGDLGERRRILVNDLLARFKNLGRCFSALHVHSWAHWQPDDTSGKLERAAIFAD